MIARYAGPEGLRLLIDEILEQWVVAHNAEVARFFAERGELLELSEGDTVIRQDDGDNDLFLILIGEVAVSVNGREIARRRAHQHVGEMALISPDSERSASVIARSKTVVLRVSEADFTQVASRTPELWRRLARELCVRLRQRNALVRPRNELPRMFIGSSKESMRIAQAVQAGLDHDNVVVHIWTDGIFRPSHFPIEDLLAAAEGSDFGVLLLGPDDEVVSRAQKQAAPRDNVIFELGLLVGAVGRERTIMVVPRGSDIKIPTDLIGLAPVEYDPQRLSEIRACVGPVCTELRNRLHDLGPR